MTRLRRIALTVVAGVLVTLPTAGSALAGNSISGSDVRDMRGGDIRDGSPLSVD